MTRRNEPGREPPRRAQRGPRERRAFPEGAVTALRGLDAGGARYLVTLGDVDGLVSVELIGEFKLRVGRVLSAEEAAALTTAAHRLQVFDLAVSLLSMRARSARDLRLGLRRRGATEDEARAAISRLSELGLIDDATYARELARTRATSGGVSRRRLQQELARRGVAPDLARQAIGDVIEEVGLSEYDAAMTVARKRMRSLGGLDAATTKRRLFAFLARRGYDAGVVSKVVSAVLGGAPGDVAGED